MAVLHAPGLSQLSKYVLATDTKIGAHKFRFLNLQDSAQLTPTVSGTVIGTIVVGGNWVVTPIVSIIAVVSWIGLV